MRTFGGGRWGYLCSLCLLLGVLARMAMATVVLIGPNVTMSFGDIEANFAPPISSSGIHGVLYLAEPLDACSSLTKKVSNVSSPPLALIIRGDCPFDEKVRNAQDAGFKSAIIYDDEDDGLIAMAGSPSGIAINAVFVAKSTGEVLKRYSGNLNMEVWILPNFDNSAWSILAISFISLLAMLAVLATCYFVRRHSVRHQRPRAPSREPPGMSSQSVKAMPSLIFTTVLEDNCTSATCAICLEDYNVGDTLRILPCRHKFHALCVDMWLTSWRTFCPVCKRDARTNVDKPPPSECTPLLSAGPASPSSPESSFHSSRPASPPVQVSLRMPRPPTSRIHSLSSTPHMLHQHRSYSASPPIHISRSSADLRNMSSLRSHASHLMSPHSLGVPFSSPVTSRFASPYIRSSGNGSPSYLVGSSSRHHFLPHSESARSSSAVASAESLPEC